tara:strand:- start:369 stop:680 length:312 start_codon:yes stop_codon:yes gene_type:complete
MKKIYLVFILILILVTSLVKNSTKKIEDKIYIVNENIRSLKVNLGDLMLEYNYLSSPEKLIEHQSQYFEDDLIKINVTKIKKLVINNGNLEIINLVDNIKIDE